MDPLLSTLVMVAVMMIVFNLLIARPAKKKAAEQAEAINALEAGTRVMTTAGVFGTVRYVGDRQAVVEISPGVEMTILKQAISKVVDPAEDEFEYDDDDETDALPGGTEAVPLPTGAPGGSTVATDGPLDFTRDRDDEFDRVVDLDEPAATDRGLLAGHALTDDPGAAPRDRA